MRTRFDQLAPASPSGAPERPGRPSSPAASPGLLVATIRPERHPLSAVRFVDELGPAALTRIRREALALVARAGPPVTVELLHAVGPEGSRAIRDLEDLARRGIRIVPATSAAPSVRAPHTTGEHDAPQPLPRAGGDADPFGIDLALRARLLPALRFLFERYWRVEVSGLEHVPAAGSAVIAANHSGAIPADAAMLAVALELRHPAARRLRVLYDRFVDQLPVLAPLYRRCGGVPAALGNAETLLARGELVGLFPEGRAALEKTWSERYRLRPFRHGAARLSIQTGVSLIPVAIVGAEEAYPLVARLYWLGGLVGVPWIPVTPLFPLCGPLGVLPLPSKWHIRFCPPIPAPSVAAGGEDEAVHRLTGALHDAVARALQELLASRAGVFV